jgi:hypothetical protein
MFVLINALAKLRCRGASPFCAMYCAVGRKAVASLLNAQRYCICTHRSLTVCMTLLKFALLKKEEQINVIKQEGTFLFIRQEAGLDIILYQVAGFYAEVFFDGTNNSIRIHSFDDTAALEAYLEQVNLSEVYHLL